MSILIKGMEMPKPGRYEAIIVVLDKSTAEIAISPAEGDVGYWKEYSLIPVPNHGRLVDADQQIARAAKLNLEAAEVISTLLRTAPTVIPAEEVE